MISYSLSWITTLYLQICSSGKQTLLTYTRESHWAKPLSSQTWTAPAKPRSGTDARKVPCSPLSFLPELVLRLLAWLSSNYGCIETRGDSCQEGQQQIPCALTDSRGHGHLVDASGLPGATPMLSASDSQSRVTTTDPVQKRWRPCMD